MSKRRKQGRKPIEQPKSRDPGGVLPMFVVGIALLAGYHFFLAPNGIEDANATTAGPAKDIVVVDSKAVLSAFMSSMESEIAAGASFTESEIHASGAEFGVEYLRAIKKYRDAGFLVIDKQYALGVPVGSEITEEIGKALSLEVKATPDPFQAPEAD